MLVTNNTLLRMPIDRDKDSLLLMRNDLELQSVLMSRAKPNTTRKVEAWLDRRLSDDCGVFFVIADAKTDDCIGFLQLVNIDLISRRGDLGICLNKQSQSRGYAKDALSQLESYAKKMFNIRKINLQVISDNHRAISFYKKMGYLHVGIMQEHFYLDDSFRDVSLMEKIY